MALEIVLDHMRPDTCRMVVTDDLFTRHLSTLLTMITHGCHPPTRLSQALGIRLTDELTIPRIPMDLHLSLSESNERPLPRTGTWRGALPPSRRPSCLLALRRTRHPFLPRSPMMRKTPRLPDEPMDTTRMALEIVMDHLRPDSCRVVV